MESTRSDTISALLKKCFNTGAGVPSKPHEDSIPLYSKWDNYCQKTSISIWV
jgi:hypothetical protein